MSVVELTARYRIVTPLFCGGADNNSQAELRLPSFKGVLRYWWRALAWSQYKGKLRDIHNAENDLFGCGGSNARRARVVMRLDSVSKHLVKNAGQLLHEDQNRVIGHGARYLGYGLVEAYTSTHSKKTEGQLKRPCLTERSDDNFEFTLRLRCTNIADLELGLLIRALKATGVVGGLGARSRRGYGSLVLCDLSQNGSPCWDSPPSVVVLKQRINELLVGTDRSGLPHYTAFSQGSRHVLLEAPGLQNPLALLDRVGREMVRFRGFGKDGKILDGRDAERKFEDDHNLVHSVARRNSPRPTSHPRRVAFGLPHNYYFSSLGESVTVEPKGLNRRASPLFIHIHMCGTSPVAVLSFLPAMFLPKGVKVAVGRHEVSRTPEPDIYKPIHDFLDRFAQGNHTESFSNVEVCP